MTAQIPKYPDYGDSGIKWLGKLPVHWETRRARHLGAFSASGIDKKTVESDVRVKMINYTDVFKSQSKILEYSETLMDTTAPVAKAREHAVREGDILLTPSSETADDIGHAARAAPMPPGVVYSYHLLRFSASARANPSYLTYCFNSAGTRSYFASVCAGTTRMVLGREDFKNAPLALPSLEEQTQIANFLDYETAKIDALIEKQQQLIRLLKEKRQAVISHAVTKGLNPDAPMRDSGVEWLGEVPAHWEVLKAAWLGSLFGSESVPEEHVVDEGPLAFIKVSSLSPEGFAVSEKNFFVSEALYRAVKPRSGFLVFPKRGAAIFTNKVNIVREYAVIDPNLMGWVLNARAVPEFIAHVLKLRGLGDIADVSTVPQINNKHVSPMKFPVPPLDEQRSILCHLDTELDQLDRLSDKVHSAVALLQERRAALISAAVTGKIDVRGWTPPESATEQEIA